MNELKNVSDVSGLVMVPQTTYYQLVDQENTVSVSILSIMTVIMKLYHHLVS